MSLEWTWTLLNFECLQALLFDWSWFASFEWSWVATKHSGQISYLGTEKARIWPLTQELNPQTTFNYFYICKGNMPFSHVQCTWTCLSALLMALLTSQSKGAVHTNRRTWFTCLSKLPGHNAGSKVPLACQSKCSSIMPIEMFFQNANRRVFQNDNRKVF